MRSGILVCFHRQEVNQAVGNLHSFSPKETMDIFRIVSCSLLGSRLSSSSFLLPHLKRGVCCCKLPLYSLLVAKSSEFPQEEFSCRSVLSTWIFLPISFSAHCLKVLEGCGLIFGFEEVRAHVFLHLSSEIVRKWMRQELLF